MAQPSKQSESYRKYDRTIKGRYRKLTYSAKKRGIPIEINLDEYRELIENASCFYCGGGLGSGYALDRKDTKKGYKKKNVVPCCPGCNSFKGHALSLKETRILMGLLKILREV